MKITICIAAFILFLSTAISCRKSAGLGSPASLTVINAIPSSQGIICLIGPGVPAPYAGALSVSYGNGQLYSPQSGARQFTVVPSEDTAKAIFQGTLNLVAGKIYSLFFAGDPAKPDTVLLADNIASYTDSSVGARFVNLLTGSQPISINLKGSSQAEAGFMEIPYKTASGFSQYAANSTAPRQYTFEVRDQASGTLIATYKWSYTLHKNNTLVIAGSTDGTNITNLRVFSIKEY